MLKWLKRSREQDPRITSLITKMDELEYALFTHRQAIREDTRDILLLQKQVEVLKGRQEVLDGKLTALNIDRGPQTIPGLYDYKSPVKAHLDNLMKG